MSTPVSTPPDDDVWLPADQQEHWKAVVALLVTLPAALDAQLRRDAGINMFEYHVLVGIADAGGEVPMTDLALLAQGSPSRLSHAVSRLERAGWVERVACEAAGRRTSARLTPDGAAKLRATAPGHAREVRRLVLDTLGPRGLATLGDAARTVVDGYLPGLLPAPGEP